MRVQTKTANRPIPTAAWGLARMSTTPTMGLVPSTRGIYRITCIPVKKHYIGQAKNLAYRFMEHNVKLLNGTHTNKAMRDAFSFYGPRAFTFEVLEFITDPSVLAMGLAEQRWMDAHDSKFNVRPAGDDNFIKWNSDRNAKRKAKLNGLTTEQQVMKDASRQELAIGAGVHKARGKRSDPASRSGAVRARAVPMSKLRVPQESGNTPSSSGDTPSPGGNTSIAGARGRSRSEPLNKAKATGNGRTKG